MRYFAVPLSVAACLALGLAGASFAAPAWTRDAGLDFWNHDAEENRLGEAEEETHRLHAVGKRLTVRVAVSNRIAFELCEDRITLDEALSELAALAQDFPDWFATFEADLHLHGRFPLTAADRDVLAYYLRGKLESMRWTAAQLGDLSRATFIRERMDRLDEEVRLWEAS